MCVVTPYSFAVKLHRTVSEKGLCIGCLCPLAGFLLIGSFPLSCGGLFVCMAPISDLVGLCRRVLSVGRKRESDSIVTLELPNLSRVGS